jgi:serine/threonine protein kinase
MRLDVTSRRARNGQRKHSSDAPRSDTLPSTSRGELVYLKDFWRVDHPEIQKEGDVYRELHESEVRNIATMGRSGDVRLTITDGQVRASVGVQRTMTQDYINHPWCPGRPVVEPYVHYRLVLETVGMPLNRFRSTRQLCEVIRDAVVGKGGFPRMSFDKQTLPIAHTDAYNKTRILHRDVSAGNILITEKGTGILIDWDLSKEVKEDADAKPRRHSRTVITR